MDTTLPAQQTDFCTLNHVKTPDEAAQQLPVALPAKATHCDWLMLLLSVANPATELTNWTSHSQKERAAVPFRSSKYKTQSTFPCINGRYLTANVISGVVSIGWVRLFKFFGGTVDAMLSNVQRFIRRIDRTTNCFHRGIHVSTSSTTIIWKLSCHRWNSVVDKSKDFVH